MARLKKQSQKIRGSLKSAMRHHKWGFLLFVSITKVANFLKNLPCKAKKYDHNWIGHKSGEVNAQTQASRWATLNLPRVSSLPLISRPVFWALLKWVYIHVPGLNRPPDRHTTHQHVFKGMCFNSLSLKRHWSLHVNTTLLTCFRLFTLKHLKTVELHIVT